MTYSDAYDPLYRPCGDASRHSPAERAEAPRNGRDASGREASFVPDRDRPGNYLQVADANA